jgi:hypothetical protein
MATSNPAPVYISNPSASPQPPTGAVSEMNPYVIAMDSRLNAMECSISEMKAQLAHISPSPATSTPTSTIAPRRSKAIEIGTTTAPAASYRFKYINAANNILSLVDDPLEKPVFKITSQSGGGQVSFLSLQKTVVELVSTSASASASSAGVTEQKDIVKGEID